MSQTREIIRERSNNITPSGKNITTEKVAVSSPEEETKVTIRTLNRTVYYIGGAIEILLLFRFTLKILGANPFSPFVSFVYTLSGIFEAPFRGIFRSAVNPGIETVSILEPSTIFAALVYAVLIIGIVELIKVLTDNNN